MLCKILVDGQCRGARGIRGLGCTVRTLRGTVSSVRRFFRGYLRLQGMAFSGLGGFGNLMPVG
jgi:hypothetical protein